MLIAETSNDTPTIKRINFNAMLPSITGREMNIEVIE
jgi:hypothetical protein